MQQTSESGIRPLIYIIDHDEHALASLASLLAPLNASIKSFTSAESFLKEFINTNKACLLLEAHLPGLGGIELMEYLMSQGHNIPTIVMANVSDIPTAVRAMQAKAIDFVEKPYIEHLVLKQVKKILEQY
jgi:FixJ family two-component response regulator